MFISLYAFKYRSNRSADFQGVDVRARYHHFPDRMVSELENVLDKLGFIVGEVAALLAFFDDNAHFIAGKIGRL